MSQKSISILIICLLIVILGEAGYIFYQNQQVSKLSQENLVHEGRDQIFRDQAAKEALRSDSLGRKLRLQEVLIALTEKQIPKIITKYETKITGINYLSADSSISLFAKRLSEKSNH